VLGRPAVSNRGGALVLRNSPARDYADGDPEETARDTPIGSCGQKRIEFGSVSLPPRPITGVDFIKQITYWQHLCHGSEMYGKLVALQRDIGRRCAGRGALRADSLRLERHPRDRMFIRQPDIL
jgi:hypothetical protein